MTPDSSRRDDEPNPQRSRKRAKYTQVAWYVFESVALQFRVAEMLTAPATNAKDAS